MTAKDSAIVRAHIENNTRSQAMDEDLPKEVASAVIQAFNSGQSDTKLGELLVKGDKQYMTLFTEII